MGNSIANIVTDKILARMQEAEQNGETFRWVKPFAIGSPNRAYSFKTMKPYNGINRLTLDNTEYLTKRMINDINEKNRDAFYHIRKGARGSIVCFYTTKPVIDKETGEPMIDEETGLEVQRKILKYTPVFSREDIVRSDNGEVLPSKFDFKHYNYDEITEQMREALDRFNRLFNYYCKKYGIKVEIIKDGTEAYFSHDMRIRVPEMTNFKSVYDYITTLAHEMAHSTGMLLGRFDNKSSVDAKIDYAKEELIAEISSEIIANELQIIDDSNTPDNAVAYINSWSSFLKDRPTEILNASAKAEKVVELLMETLKEMELSEEQNKNKESEDISDER